MEINREDVFLVCFWLWNNDVSNKITSTNLKVKKERAKTMIDLDLAGRKITQAIRAAFEVFSFNIKCRVDVEKRRLDVETNRLYLSEYEKNFFIMFSLTDDAWLNFYLFFESDTFVRYKLDKNELNLFLINEMNRNEPLLSSYIDERNSLMMSCRLSATTLDQVATQANKALWSAVNALSEDAALKSLIGNMHH